jgi:hypothetical protein
MRMIDTMLGCIVPVVDTATERRLLGTGIVVSPTAVITCRHVIDPYREMGLVIDPGDSEIGLALGTEFRPPSRIIASAGSDLCCLHFDSLRSASPAALFRTANLAPLKLAAAGFVNGASGPQRHEIPEFEAILEEQHGGWVQTAQLRGGAPPGFSGAPVFVRAGKNLQIIGMLRLGGELAAVSRLIGADPIAKFLAETGVDVAISDLPPEARHAAKSASQVKLRVGRTVDNSTVWLSGGEVDVDIGRDLRKSELRIKGQDREGEASQD